MFKVISFYTIGTPYETEIQGLIASLNKFGVPHDIRGLPSLGSWEKNACQKPVFIRDRLLELPDTALVWLDADSVVMKRPVLFDCIDTDIAVYYKTTGPAAERFGGFELVTATLFFRRNARVIDLLDMWIEEQGKPEQPTHCLFEQRALQRVIPLWVKQHGGTVTWLPQSYCRIFDAPEDHRVIVQNQASRRFGR